MLLDLIQREPCNYYNLGIIDDIYLLGAALPVFAHVKLVVLFNLLGSILFFLLAELQSLLKVVIITITEQR